jgi:hypothetical protein
MAGRPFGPARQRRWNGHSRIRKWATSGLSIVQTGGDGGTPRPYPDLTFIGPSALKDFQWMTNHVAPLK